MECAGCNNDNATMNHQLPLCKVCYNLSSMKLMSKQRAMETYALTQTDLATLRSARGKNPYSKQMYTVLYLIDDVEDKAIEKFGSKEKILKKINDREAKKNEKILKNKADKSRRKSELGAHLYKIGLGTVRPDSVICTNYIDKGADAGFTVDEIGQILKEMDFYFKYTNYKTLLRQVRADSREQYGWHLDEDEVRDEAKELALTEFVKKNYMDHHAMVIALPESLKVKAFGISDTLYNNNGRLPEEDRKKEEKERERELANKLLDDSDDEDV